LTSLEASNVARLRLALNFSVFLHELKKEKELACAMAKGAFDEAIGTLDSLEEEKFREVALIMQLLRDNVTLWSSPEEADV